MSNNNYFDEAGARCELEQMILARKTNDNYTVFLKNGKTKIKTYNIPSTKLILILQNLHQNILKKPAFNKYPYFLQVELSSKAMLDFLEWGHNYKVGKSAYSYLTEITINSYRRSLSKYYKNVNEQKIIREGIALIFGGDVVDEADNNYEGGI